MLKRISRVAKRFAALPARINRIQEALGRIEQRQLAQSGLDPAACEFRVFSQWGEDGILQALLGRVPIERKIFVEFGVESYVESNTRFLVVNNQWAGLVIDGGEQNINDIKLDSIYWAANLKAECAFVTRENIEEILQKNGIRADIGLLSIDIDGNDYWVWQAIRCITPRIVICEYNSDFGPTAQVTVPYDPAFVRGRAHYSKVYYGASISALCALGASKGYSLVAGNSAGNNIFFVRNDLLGSLHVLTPEQAYRRAQFREFHDEHGALTFDDRNTRLRKIGGLPVLDVASGQVGRIADHPGITGEIAGA
jgi:hypothetical protein